MRPKLQYMSMGAAVAELQGKLNMLMPTAVPALKVDGKFGDKTLARVKQFQGSRGLVKDGIVGTKTWAAIDGQAPPPEDPQSTGTQAPPNLPGWDYVFPAVHSGDQMYCTYGTETRGIKINPPNRPANIWDQKAMTNIPPFGGCYSMQNPSVAAINKTFQEAQGPLGPLFGPSQEDLGFKKNYGKNVIPGPCKPLFTELWKGSHRLEMVGTPPARAIEKGCRADCIYGGIVKFVK